MSPSKFRDSDVTKGMINGPRPLPLRVNKNSHVINKNPSSNHQPAAAESAAASDQLGVKLPVIIYTHSPKVIHTRAGAFMAVVQRLTGLQRDEDSDGDEGAAAKTAAEAIKEQDSFSCEKEIGGGVNGGVGYDEHNDTTSVLIDDRRIIGGVKQEAAAVPPMYKMSNAYLIDAPLFTPNSNEFYCSARPNPFFQSPNMAAAANSISPSFMDYMKAFPDC